jgi:branched-chain amino acid transport system ATP-binding protein
MISIVNLSVEFGGVRPLNGLTVELSGSIVGVVGPNGAGKTTLLNVLSGFVIPVSGTVTAFGENLLAMPSHMSVWDNVAVMLDTVRLSGQERKQQVASALKFVGLAGAEARRGQNLNSFERRLVEIGRAVVGKPRIVLMDEPGAGLSGTESASLQTLVSGIPGYCGAMVVLVDHDVNLIAATCASTAVLDFGSLIAHGRTEDVLRDERVKAAYLGTEGVL